MKNNNELKIKKILDDLRPFLNEDGGDIEFIKYEDKILYLKLTGACSHCLYQDNTSSNLLRFIQNEVPEVIDIINVNI